MLAAALWLEALLISVLWAALADAVVARWSRRWRWGGLAIGFAPIVCLLGLTAFAGRAELNPKLPLQLHLFQSLFSLTVVSIVAAIVVWCLGFTGAVPSRPPAASWPQLILAVALTVFASLLFVSLSLWETGVQRQAAALRRDAETVSESFAPPRVPDRDNAAPIYMAIYESLAAEGAAPDFIVGVAESTLAERQPGGDPPVDPQSPELAVYLQRHAPELALLRVTAARPGCRFPRDYRRMTFVSLMPELPGCRRLGFLLIADARYRAAAGDLHTALADIQAADALGEQIAQGWLINLLVGAAIESAAADSLESILQTEPILSDDLSLLELDRGGAFRERLPGALRVEEAMGTKAFAALMDGADPSQIFGIKPSQHFPWLFQYVLLPVDCAGYRRQMDEAIPAIESTEKYDSLVKKMGDIAAEAPSGMLSAIFAPATQACFQAVVRCDAKLAAMRTGVAMHRFRAAHGKFPATRDELAAEFMIPADPYDGKPIRFKITDHGWIVYSIGPDLVDDGGKRLDHDNQKGDIVFEYRGTNTKN